MKKEKRFPNFFSPRGQNIYIFFTKLSTTIIKRGRLISANSVVPVFISYIFFLLPPEIEGILMKLLRAPVDASKQLKKSCETLNYTRFSRFGYHKVLAKPIVKSDYYNANNHESASVPRSPQHDTLT